MGEKRDNTLSSVKNALRVLKSFSIEEPEKKITDLANSLNLGTSTVSRLMTTLASEGFVYKKNQRYRLGWPLLSLSGVVTSDIEIHTEATPVLHSLLSKTGETSHLNILENREVICIHKVESNHTVRTFTHIGSRNPLHCTSSGKVLLAFNEKDLFDEIIENDLISYTHNTISDPKKLKEALKEIREHGYAISREELYQGVTAIAAPIRDYTGRVVAAVNTIGPIQRINSHTIPNHIKRVCDAAKEISERLGYFPTYKS
ncbi:transcriptional regulator [Halalkalibacter wakoensis JCM 9140]|uniref:Transcriptional regulator n=1 Tax=Halalkalibacter wakoensis JCM 9140 TaxID=1236970 RepID=W4QB02_9BACI|nr:IclR family transcriptional regulator [Halalkalibacter wakoensis]GAE28554.1 transcriptional regulator [Halalkalibacter wakoensis JCM 9140]